MLLCERNGMDNFPQYSSTIQSHQHRPLVLTTMMFYCLFRYKNARNNNNIESYKGIQNDVMVNLNTPN